MAQIADRSRITCSGCDTTWTGISRAHCGRCHETFAGATWFDRHQVGYQCVDPATITNGKTGEAVMRRSPDGIWRSAKDWDTGDLFREAAS